MGRSAWSESSSETGDLRDTSSSVTSETGMRGRGEDDDGAASPFADKWRTGRGTGADGTKRRAMDEVSLTITLSSDISEEPVLIPVREVGAFRSSALYEPSSASSSSSASSTSSTSSSRQSTSRDPFASTSQISNPFADPTPSSTSRPPVPEGLRRVGEGERQSSTFTLESRDAPSSTGAVYAWNGEGDESAGGSVRS